MLSLSLGYWLYKPGDFAADRILPQLEFKKKKSDLVVFILQLWKKICWQFSCYIVINLSYKSKNNSTVKLATGF